MIKKRHIVASVFVAFWVWVDIEHWKTPYQFEPIEGDVPIKTLQGEAVPNHGFDGIRRVWERNSISWVSIWVSALILSSKKGFCYLGIIPGTLILDISLFGLLGLGLFDTDIGMWRMYETGDIFLDNCTGHGHDLGFNLYNGTLNKTMAQAQKDKWDHMLAELELQPGDRLLDCGCGYGDWLAYAKSKGIHVMGINLSPDQAWYANRNFGIKVVNDNWKNFLKNTSLQSEHFGKFDA